MESSQAARNDEYARRTQDQIDAFERAAWYHAIEFPDGTAAPGLISVADLRRRIESFPVPAELRGKRVLDVGAATGWNAFEAERRGAEAVAIDCVEYEEFRLAAERLGSRADYRILDVDELTPDRVGLFDYCLFFGVLYHLRHPLLGLERLCSVTREAAFVESFVIDDPAVAADELLETPPRLEFYETDELGGQLDNWHGPNAAAVLAMCRAAGFARVRLEYLRDRKAGVSCFRRWEPPHRISERAPVIDSVQNNRTNEPVFHRYKDEYLNVYFASPFPKLTKDSVFVEVDGFGVPALLVAQRGGQDWQACLKSPPGWSVGRHELRLWTASSAPSEPYALEVREAGGRKAAPASTFAAAERAPDPPPVIASLENSRSRSRTFRGYKSETLCCRLLAAGRELDRRTVLAETAGQMIAPAAVIPAGAGRWQVNLRLPPGLERGTHALRLRTAWSPFSEPAQFDFEPEA